MSRRLNRYAIALSLLALMTIAGALGTGPQRTQAHHLCGATGSPLGAFDLQTYEAADYRNVYARTMELAGFNQLFPELGTFALPGVEGVQPSPYIPPVLLKSIAWLESGWAQGSYDPLVPYGEIGPVLSSHDCGYGIMQITSGMQNVSGVPNLDQAMIGGHYAFNIARGARILAEKWNLAPEYRPVVGSRNSQTLEDWYYALWGYNGFASKNHPLTHDPNRAPYLCDGTQPRSNYPYQELVFGCVAHPPVRGGSPLWPAQPVSLPNLADPAFAGLANWDAFNACVADASQCWKMNMPTPSPSNTDPTSPSLPRSQVIGTPSVALSTGSILLVAQSGGQSPNQSFAIGNGGSGLLAWRLTTSAPWLRLSHIQGVSLGADLGYRDQTITLYADASSLLPGTHTARITLESLYGTGAGATVEVTLQTADGAIVGAPDGRIYVLQGGLKRYIPDPATFEANGFSWSGVIPVPAEWAAAVPTGQSLLSVMANGQLLRPPGEAVPIYVMENGAKRHIIGPNVFTQCGYGWDAVYVVSSDTLSFIPAGSPLTGVPCPRLSLVDGTLLAGSDGRVWVMRANLRRWISGPTAFAGCRYMWGNVNKVADGLIGQFSPWPDVTGCTDEGSLILTPDGKVHVLLAGRAHHIPDPPTFEAQGFDGTRITPVSEATAPVGAPVLSVLATGSLVRPVGNSVPVYVLDGGVKRHIAGPDIFAACGYVWTAVTVLSSGTIDSIPAGPALAGGTCPRLAVSDGTLLLGPEGAVWVTIGLAKKWVASPGALSDCRYDIANLIPVSAALFAQFAPLQPVTSCTAAGSLLAFGGKVYLVVSGVKRHVPNPPTFEAARLSWSAIAPLQQDLLPTGKPLLDAVATGRLIRPPGGEVPVYVMDGGQKRHITGPAVLDACAYSWAAVSELPAATVAGFADGPPLSGTPCPQPSFADGVLLSGSDGKVWVTQAGQRRWITGPDIFGACGYLWANVNSVADSIISSLPLAANLTGGPCPQ